MVRHLPMYDKIPNWNQCEILFLLISAKLMSLDPTLLYCINSDWTTLSIGGKKLVSLGTTKFGVLDGKSSTHVWQNTELKSMGNTVSAHICQIKVVRPYPVILYRLRLDHSIHWWKKMVSLGMTKFGVLDGKASTHVWQNPQLKSMGNTVSAHICQIKVVRPYPVILYKLRLDHSIHWWKKMVSLGMTKFGVLDSKASTHIWQNPQLKSMGNTVSAHICQIKVVRPYPVILYKLRLDHSIHWWKKMVSLGMTKFGVLDSKASTHIWQNPQLKSMGNTVSAHICQIKVVRPYPVILYKLRLAHSIHWWKKIDVPRNDQIWRTRW